MELLIKITSFLTDLKHLIYRRSLLKYNQFVLKKFKELKMLLLILSRQFIFQILFLMPYCFYLLLILFVFRLPKTRILKHKLLKKRIGQLLLISMQLTLLSMILNSTVYIMFLTCQSFRVMDRMLLKQLLQQQPLHQMCKR